MFYVSSASSFFSSPPWPSSFKVSQCGDKCCHLLSSTLLFIVFSISACGLFFPPLPPFPLSLASQNRISYLLHAYTYVPRHRPHLALEGADPFSRCISRLSLRSRFLSKAPLSQGPGSILEDSFYSWGPDSLIKRPLEVLFLSQGSHFPSNSWLHPRGTRTFTELISSSKVFTTSKSPFISKVALAFSWGTLGLEVLTTHPEVLTPFLGCLLSLRTWSSRSLLFSRSWFHHRETFWSRDPSLTLPLPLEVLFELLETACPSRSCFPLSSTLHLEVPFPSLRWTSSRLTSSPFGQITSSPTRTRAS